MSLSSSLNRATTAFKPWKKMKPANAQSWTGYSSCEVLPLSVFVDCLIDNKYERLTISGSVSRETLHIHWLKLYSEYCKLSANEAMTAVVMQMGHIEALDAKINQCKRLLNELYKGENQTFIDCLKDWGYRLKYDSPEQYERELNRIVALLKGEEERLKTLCNAASKTGKETTTRADFIQQLAGISKFMGIAVRLNDPLLTVAEYCGYLKMMKEHYEANKPKVAHA